MSGAKRDPRVDPVKGDVLRNGTQERRVVQIHQNGCVDCREFLRTIQPLLHQWRKWAATAEVVHLAEVAE